MGRGEFACGYAWFRVTRAGDFSNVSLYLLLSQANNTEQHSKNSAASLVHSETRASNLRFQKHLATHEKLFAVLQKNFGNIGENICALRYL